jgi:hypothetical protein
MSYFFNFYNLLPSLILSFRGIGLRANTVQIRLSEVRRSGASPDAERVIPMPFASEDAHSVFI